MSTDSNFKSLLRYSSKNKIEEETRKKLTKKSPTLDAGGGETACDENTAWRGDR